MKRAIDEIIEIHTKDEIERLKQDIHQKCEQIAKLLGASEEHPILWTNNEFYVMDGKKKKKIF